MKSDNESFYSTDKLLKTKLIKHDSIESLESVFWGVPVNELQNIKIEADTSSGEILKSNYTEHKKQIENNGYWGFAITDKNEIHYWAKPDTSKEDLIFFFAHELGHIVGTPDKDDWEEELRADSYAEVTLKTFEFLNSIINL